MDCLSSRIDRYIDDHGDISAQQWYEYWKNWLDTLMRAPIDGTVYYACQSDDVLYSGSANHALDHPNAFSAFLNHTQLHCEEWIDMLLVVVDRYQHVPVIVSTASSDADGEYQFQEYTIAFPELLTARLFKGSYLAHIPYRAEIHALLNPYASTLYQDAAWETFRTQGEHSNWSDLGLIYHGYNHQQGYKPYGTMFEQRHVSTNDSESLEVCYTRYTLWLQERVHVLRDVQWDELPNVFTQRKTWHDMLTLSVVCTGTLSMSLFPDLPKACQHVFQQMIDAYHALMKNLDMPNDVMIHALLMTLPEKTNIYSLLSVDMAC